MIWAFYLRSVPFTRGVISGQESLGGSESACVGLMRALVARGHSVLAFAHDLADDAIGRDHGGVVWVPAADLRSHYRHWQFDVFVSLRMPEAFVDPPDARWKVLWNQDLLIDQPRGTAATIGAASWPIDTLAYVSEYHRRQWEGKESILSSLGWVTRNGFDPDKVPNPLPAKVWNRVLHISRPERGLGPLLRMWPKLRQLVPTAELHLCRYSSMYDRDGWGRVCAAYDEQVAAVNAKIGGIVWLGELGKPALYQAIAEAAVMWYPGISTFAETSCIAAIESQACGTPFVGSLRGALAETCAVTDLLIDGKAEDAKDTSYETAAVETVRDLLIGCRDTTGGRYESREAEAYRAVQQAGRDHVFPAYTYDAIAAEWEQAAVRVFASRLGDGTGALRALLHTDDHVAALWGMEHGALPIDPDAIARCQRVIAGEDQGAEDYAEGAQTDPVHEGNTEPRFILAADRLAGCTHVLDVAAGNGACAIKVALTHPTVKVTGLDYSEDLVARANAHAERLGLSDRVRFERLTVYDYQRHTLTREAEAWMAAHQGQFDGLFVGEFLEHCAGLKPFVDGLEVALTDGAVCVFTMPRGPFIELMTPGLPVRRGHVHSFEIDDLQRVFGAKRDVSYQTYDHGVSLRGSGIGNWIVSYRTSPEGVTGERDLEHRVWSTRPLPVLSVGILANEKSHDLRRCLESIREIADEIVIGDSSARGTMVADLAKEYGATVLPIGRPTDLTQQPDGFAGARNQVLAACTGDWFLWIDTDETLEGAHALRKYLSSGPFIGYAIAQNHLMLDAPQHADKPVRLFKRRPDIQFYGCVHEQPQQGDCNGDIFPCLELPDVAIAHIGYKTEPVRRGKAARNMPLLVANHERFPTRRLNGVLDIRQLVLSANDEVAAGNTQGAEIMYRSAIVAFERDYADPADKIGALARPFYEMALANLNGAWEFEYAFAGTQGRLNGRTARTKRVRVRSYEDLERVILHDVRQAREQMAGDVPDTAPIRVAEMVA